jgi:hypothetical protein
LQQSKQEQEQGPQVENRKMNNKNQTFKQKKNQLQP